ncbi:MAG: hypothetical protein RR191_00755 [Cetobacterium sp.]|uniref:hypothetical protein n=1 Tax=unclassified Cetobacterium TaxID=2630983 RepID=UPI00163D2A51|nr:hypothetical protein [Cetobacterium sp. 2A]MBC2856542.1 hypothetical protein [Cetobacterium sp. 2A]
MNRLENLLEEVELLDKRAYFTIDQNGIKRKEMNMAIPSLAFIKDEQLFEEILESLVDPKERVKLKSIDRMSSLELSKLKDNFIKIMANGDLDFSKRYGKELALRDKESFLKLLYEISLMENIEFLKPLMALSLEEILKTNEWNDNIWYLVISYFTKQRFDFSGFESADTLDVSKESLMKEVLESKKYLENKEGLALLSYVLVLQKYNYKNENKFIFLAKDKLEKIKSMKKLKQLSEIEEKIFQSLFLKEE